MRHIAIFVALSLSVSSQAGELRLDLHGKGMAGKQVRVAIYLVQTQTQFPSGEKSYRSTVQNAVDDSLTVVVPDLPAGKYAVASYVDANMNGRLDKNLFGVPTEIYGFSNEARGRFGPPSFAEAAFEVWDATVVQTIHLK